MEDVGDLVDSKVEVAAMADKSSCVSPAPSPALPVPSEIVETQRHFATVTPQKSIEKSHVNCNKQPDLLPHNYATLLHFLHRMASSLRLLALRNYSPTFRNIRRQLQILTGRKFEYKHLAQIKYMLPEAVKIDKILAHNVETMCMTPDIKVTLILDIVEGHHEESAFIALHHLLASRLINFFHKHPEVCDIPEAALPETFSQGDATIDTHPWPADVSPSTKTETVKSSHFCPSFSRHFCERAIGEESDKTTLAATPFPGSSFNCDSLIGEEIAREMITPDSFSEPTINRDSVNSSPVHVSSSTFKSNLKFVSEGDNVMLETPAQSSPKRSLSASEGKHKTMITQTCMSCNQTAKRSLDFSNPDFEESLLNLTLCELDQSRTLPSTSIQTEMKSKTVSASFVTSREDKKSICYSGKGLEINQSCLPANHQASICLSELVISIQKIFQSVNRRSMTKDELVHKIIMNNCDIDENCHIEEQIDLLEKLLPGWICQKLAPSGDLLYSIEEVSDLNSVLQKIAIT